MPTIKDIFFILGSVYFFREIFFTQAAVAPFHWWLIPVWFVLIAVWSFFHFINKPAK